MTTRPSAKKKIKGGRGNQGGQCRNLDTSSAKSSKRIKGIGAIRIKGGSTDISTRVAPTNGIIVGLVFECPTDPRCSYRKRGRPPCIGVWYCRPYHAEEKAMKIVFENQILEFLCEIALFILWFVPMGLFFSPAPQPAERGFLFALNLWAIWVLYRSIFLQIPLVMYAKHCLWDRKLRAQWMNSLVNVVSILLSFILFGVFFGDAQSFFLGEHVAIPVIFFLAGIVAPYSVKLCRAF